MQRTKKLEENKIKTRQQNKGRKIKTLLLSPIHLAHHRSAVALISLRCCTADVAPAVATQSHRYHTTVAPLLSLLLLLRSRTSISPLSHRYPTDIAPLLRHCRSAAVAPAVATQSIRSRTAIAPLSLRCRAVVEPLLLRPREGIKKIQN